MYICARGRLQVVDTDGKAVLATLKAGSYFGEIRWVDTRASNEDLVETVKIFILIVLNQKKVISSLPLQDEHFSKWSTFSILNMGTAGNRRTASVRSVGYSDLFVLSKTDMWDVLKDYPAARVRLEAVAAKKIERYKKVPLEKGESHDLSKLLKKGASSKFSTLTLTRVEMLC